ncbi:MAG: hypothetical protein WAL80_13835 [Xanthobacteraceae bacterium]
MKRTAKYLATAKYAAIVLSAIAVTYASTSFAKPLRNEVDQQQSAPGFVADNPRDAAIHDCSVEASKWSFSTWQSTQIITYGDCMAAHGQIE